METFVCKNVDGEVVKTITESDTFIGVSSINGDTICADFSGLDLRGTNFYDWNFDNCNFKGANLEGCNLRYNAFAECVFVNSNLTGVLLTEGYARWGNSLHGAKGGENFDTVKISDGQPDNKY